MTLNPSSAAHTRREFLKGGAMTGGALAKPGDVTVLPCLVEITVAPDREIAKAAHAAMVAFPAAEAVLNKAQAPAVPAP